MTPERLKELQAKYKSFVIADLSTIHYDPLVQAVVVIQELLEALDETQHSHSLLKKRPRLAEKVVASAHLVGFTPGDLPLPPLPINTQPPSHYLTLQHLTPKSWFLIDILSVWG